MNGIVNDQKIIICLYATANRGKTKTIRGLFLRLGGNKNAFNGKHDFVSEVNFGNKKIGFASQGDPNSTQKADIEQLAMNNCDIIVTASRTKGGTVDNVSEIANRYGYVVVWISPFYFYDEKDATDDLFNCFAEQNAENIAKYIIELI